MDETSVQSVLDFIYWAVRIMRERAAWYEKQAKKATNDVDRVRWLSLASGYEDSVGIIIDAINKQWDILRMKEGK